MTATISQYVYPSQLTPVIVASDANYSGTYFNGINNNGVGATLTITGTAEVDSVILNVGDRVLFWQQTNAYENGIYIVKVAGGSETVYVRSDDFQSIEQIKPGYNVAVMQGSTYAGMVLTTKGPQIQFVGVDDIVFVSASEVGPYRTFLNDELKIEHPNPAYHTTFHMADTAASNSKLDLDLEGTTRAVTLGGNIFTNSFLSFNGSVTTTGDIETDGAVNLGGTVTTVGAFATNQATTINTFGASLCNTAAYSNALSALKVLYIRTPTADITQPYVYAFPGITANSVITANINSPSTSEHITRIEPATDQITFHFSGAPGAGSWLTIIAIAVP